MIVVRDIFQLKFGQAKEATQLWKQGIGIIAKMGYGKAGTRVLTDLAGPPYYTLVIESTYESVSEWETAGKAVRGNPAWNAVYQKIAALTEQGRREILSVIQ